MISFVFTSVSSAAQYIPFAPKSRPTRSSTAFDDTDDLSLRVRLASIANSSSASTTAFSQSARSDSNSRPSTASSSSSSSSTAYSSPPSSPTSSESRFPPSSTSSPELGPDPEPSSSRSAPRLTQAELAKYAVIHEILQAHDLYAVLDAPRTCDTNALRRAYMKRCKACHPDKYPSYPLATVAFQKVSFAYDILSKPSSRRLYDLHGILPEDPYSNYSKHNNHGDGYDSNGHPDNNGTTGFTHPSNTARADETLSGVLLGVFCDFMEGDFQMLRTFLKAMNEVNPALNVSEDTIESLVSTFVRLREVLLTGQKYVRILHIELIHLYEIQHSLRALPYLDISGRLRLTLRLARCTLALPCVVDAVMVREAEERERERDRDREDVERTRSVGEPGGVESGSASPARVVESGSTSSAAAARRGGLLHPKVNSMLQSVCGVLEYGEKII